MASANARILLADDNPHGLELLEAYLGATEYETRTAVDGEDTLRVIRDWKPDVVLLDIMMPRISGFEVCKCLRADPALKDTGVIMVTALDQPADIDRAVDAGTDDFLTKPIDQKDLLNRVKAMISARRAGDEVSRSLAYIQAVEAASAP